MSDYRKLIVEYMDRLYRMGLTTTSGGNLSVMDEEGNIWITPSGTDKGEMTPDDIVCVKKDKTVIGELKPSSELPLHSLIYAANPDKRAICHAHSPALIAYSVIREIPNKDLFVGSFVSDKKITIAEYAMFGTTRLGEIISTHFKTGSDIVIMENHGMVSAAPTLKEAFEQFEALEFLAKIQMNVNRL